MRSKTNKHHLLCIAIILAFLGVINLQDAQSASKPSEYPIVQSSAALVTVTLFDSNLANADAPTVRITGVWVNLRQGPSTTFGLAGSALINETFEVVGQDANGGWYEIAIDPDTTAWVHADLVELSGDISEAPISKPALTVADLLSTQDQADSEESTDDEEATAAEPATDGEETTAVEPITVEEVAVEETILDEKPTLRIDQPQVNLRSGPGTAYAVVGGASVDEEFDVIGRNAAGDWYNIRLPNEADSDDQDAWVYAPITEFRGELSDVGITAAPEVAEVISTEAAASNAVAPTAAEAEPQAAAAPPPSTAGLAGTLLYSVANLDDNRWELWEYSFGAGSSTKIGDWWTEIDVSNDGAQVVYYFWAEEGSDDTGIWIMDRDYTNNRLVVPGGAYPSFSPGGDRLVLNGGPDIYVINTDGGGLRGLTVGEYPAWSPVNDQVVHRACVGGACGLWLIDANSNDPAARSRVTTGGSDGQPAWSPDGQRIAYISQDDGNFEIYVINTDGSGKARLTTDAASDGLPVWSPDGQWIAFRSDRGGSWAIYVMRPDGSDLRKIVDADVLPAWFFEKMSWY